MRKKISADYKAYLLRLWREDDLSGWRASLENPHTGKLVGFPSLHHLIKFLEEKAGDDKLNENV